VGDAVKNSSLKLIHGGLFPERYKNEIQSNKNNSHQHTSEDKNKSAGGLYTLIHGDLFHEVFDFAAAKYVPANPNKHQQAPADLSQHKEGDGMKEASKALFQIVSPRSIVPACANFIAVARCGV
jgi:hypothetical protein